VRHFLDTSALVKCYRAEAGSPWMNALLLREARLYISPNTEAELLATLARERRQHAHRFHATFDAVIQRARRELAETFRIMQPSRRLFELAADVALSGDMRGCDAVQLAAALRLNEALEARGSDESVVFVAADDTLLLAASGRGLAIENPLVHS
jgi:predicted nucleic acid-binding protein